MHRTSLQSLVVIALAAAQVAAADPAALWSGSVRALFDLHCVKCHGPIEQKSGLELDTPEAVLKGGDEGKAVVPGDPEKSRLYQFLASGAETHMPPKKQLTEAERSLVRDWIVALGAAPASTASKQREPRKFGSIPEAIDTLIAEGWTERGLIPAEPVDDRTWCRRVHLDLVGRIPTPAETDAFLTAPAETRRAGLVDRLLVSDGYAVRMRELWDFFLMGRPRRDAHEDRRRQNGWWVFLEESFRTNRPWNETVRELLVARPTNPEQKGASWFLYERRNDHQAIAEAVAPVVYGTRIDCAQCHDHPLAREIKQGHYWGLVAAFNRGKNIDGGSTVAESAVGGFINFTNLRKESQPAIITLLNGRRVDETRPAPDAKEEDGDDRYVDPPAKPRVPKFSRREAFALAATQDNALLARAFVNRAWAVFLGRGLVHPADEMNARNVPSHPELLDWLASDFAASGHDVRRWVRGVVLSRAYALGMGTTPPETFASALERPLTGEQIARSWRVAAGLSPDDDGLRKAVVGAIPDVLPRDYNATFQQAQFLANSPGLAQLTQPASGGTAVRLIALPAVATRVREAFVAVYGRLPDAEEEKQAGTFLSRRAERPAEAVRDLLWAMMTGAEFLTMP